jgi:hypothetical protein
MMDKILLILCLFLSACGHTVYVPVVSSPDCYVPERPAYTQLDPTEHIASRNNIERLMLAISDMSAYTKRLESSAECFIASKATEATETKGEK